MRYTSSSCSIPGGGRIYIRTADGNSYTVPSGASSDLIYVGFKNGEMTITPTRAENYIYDPEDGISLGAASVTGGWPKPTTSKQDFFVTSEKNRSAILLIVRFDENDRQLDYRQQELSLIRGGNTASVTYDGDISGTKLAAFLVSSDTWSPITEKTEWTFARTT